MGQNLGIMRFGVELAGSYHDDQGFRIRAARGRLPTNGGARHLPEQKTQLEEMAEAWEALARDRAEQVRRNLVAERARSSRVFQEKPH
jgi:hypothetical protein